MVPNFKQGAASQANRLKITQADPLLIKKFCCVETKTARQRDPRIAALYYDQMLNKGRHHTKAICICATHSLDRVLVVLREVRAYELQDVDSTPLTKEQAVAIVQGRYRVPEEV